MNTKIQATRKAKALAKRLGKKWKISVWENIGWHYCVSSRCGKISVYDSEYKNKITYYCMITSSNFHGVGDPGWYSKKYFKDPKRAVKDSIRVFEEQVEDKKKVLALIKGMN